MKIQILNRFNSEVIHEGDFKDIKEAVEDAVKKEISLKRADLRGADLQQADLSGAYFRGTNLQRANLSGAILINTKF